MTNNSCLTARNLSFSFGEIPAIQDINVEFARGKITGIMGPNGGGKSTLLQCLSGIIEPQSGDVLAFDDPLSEHQKKISYIPQKEKIDWDFPITVKDLVKTALYQRLKWYECFSENYSNCPKKPFWKWVESVWKTNKLVNFQGGNSNGHFLLGLSCQMQRFFYSTNLLQGWTSKPQKTLSTF